MRHQWKIWLATLTLVAIVGCSGQSSKGGREGRNLPRATEDETRQAFEKLMSAFARKDAAAVNDIMSSSAIFIDPPVGPGVFNWTDARPTLEKAFSSSGNYQLTNEAAYKIGVERDLGWIATVYHVRTMGPKGLEQSDGAVSVLFQKTDNGYKALMFHASRFLPPPTAPTDANAKPAEKAVPKGAKK